MKHFKLTLFLLTSIMLSVSLAGFAATAVGNPDLVVPFATGLFVASLISTNNAGILTMATTINLTDIITEWGAYYRGTATVKDLITKFFQKSETEEHFTRRRTDLTRLELGQASINRVVQRFQLGFTPIGDIVFTPNHIDLFKMKVDMAFYPDVVEESWLGFLADNKLDRKDWPLVKYILEQLVIPQIQEDIEKNEIFFGVPGAIIPGTPTLAGKSMLGIREQLKRSGIQTIVSGAVPTDPVLFVEYMESLFYSIPELDRNRIDKFFMSKTLETRFKTGMRKAYNMNYNQAGDLLTIIDTNMQIKGLASHGASTTIWTTPADNRIIGIKKPDNEKVFKLEESKREVDVLTDFYKGVGFWNDAWVYRNDVVIP